MDDLIFLFLLSIITAIYLFQKLFRHSSFEKNILKTQIERGGTFSTYTLEANVSPPPKFILAEVSLPVTRSLWRIVEHVITDFIDYWWGNVSQDQEFGNDGNKQKHNKYL
jgi:hypothetical protein